MAMLKDYADMTQSSKGATSMPLPKRCSASPSRVSFSSLSATFAPEAASLYCSASSIFTPAQKKILKCLTCSNAFRYNHMKNSLLDRS